MQVTAEEVLRAYDNASLKQMAAQRRIDAKSMNKEALIPVLARTLFDEGRVREALESLAPRERALLDRLVLAGGASQTSLLKRQLEDDGLVEKPAPDTRYGYSSYYRREQGSVRAVDSTNFADLIARLGVLGLTFTADPEHSSGFIVKLTEPGRRLFVPDDILQHLPPVEDPVETAPAPATVREAQPGLLLRDLYLLLSAAGREQIQLTKGGLILKRFLTRMQGALTKAEDAAAARTEEDLAWLPFLRGLAQDLGLLAASVGSLVVLDEQVEDFMRLPAGERRLRVWEAYRRATHWCELYRVPDLTVRGKGAALHDAPPDVVAARERVLAEVAALPVGEWVALEHLVARVRRRAYEFLFERRTAGYGYYSSYYGYGYNTPHPYDGTNPLGLTFNVSQEDAGWDKVEGGFIRVIVQEALHPLGVVDLGGGGDTDSALRLTPDGARLLRGEAPPTETAAPQVIVQPNFHLFVFEPVDEQMLYALDRLAERLTVDQAIEYELTRDSVYRAQQAGLDVAAVIELLERLSSVGIPQNVRRTLEEWGALHEQVTVRKRAPLLHAVDEAALDSLYADAELAELLGRRLAPAVALVRPDGARELAERLTERGQLPALSEGPGFTSGSQIEVDERGRITFVHAVPSAFALRELRAFADGDEAAGSLRLTGESLRRGARAGIEADAVLATLEQLHAGPLPEETTAFVRRWAKNWGSGALFEGVVLQVDQPETLANLLADPQIRRALQPVPGAPTIALVRREEAERLRAQLEELGMTLGSG